MIARPCRVTVSWRRWILVCDVTLGRPPQTSGPPDRWDDGDPDEVDIVETRDGDRVLYGADLDVYFAEACTVEASDEIDRLAVAAAERLRDEAMAQRHGNDGVGP